MEINPEEKRLVRNNNLVLAVKFFKERNGVSLMMAYQICKHYRQGFIEGRMSFAK
jgi:hypothetical protein